MVFVLFLEAIGERVLLYAVEGCFETVFAAFSASNSCFARDESPSQRVGDVGLSRKPNLVAKFFFFDWICPWNRSVKNVESKKSFSTV